jgi:molybdenum cofactor cytidylyltransferase
VAVDLQTPHETAALAETIAGVAAGPSELIVVFGASAITDRRDVIPAAIEAAGGRVEHFGMPVDPGNLLLVGELRGKPVVGAPGCARSPKENGFDWVLQRLLAGLPVGRAEIARLGVGGLLMEIVQRGQLRDAGPHEPD